MFKSNVYRVMIGCPGDIQEEVQIAKEVISRWTNLHAEQNNTVLLPVNWVTNSYPEHGAHPQKILNKQITKKSDLFVGIFGARIGSPTDTSISGTVEEIEEHIANGKPVMLFFRKFNDTTSVSSEELAQLDAFKKSIKNRCLYREYNQIQDFEQCFTNALELFLADNWLKQTAEQATSAESTTQQKTIQFSEEEIDRVRKWVESGNNTAFVVSVKDGPYYILGNDQYSVPRGREEAKWKDFIERLQKVGFISFVRFNKQGSPVYELQMSAYDYFDNQK